MDIEQHDSERQFAIAVFLQGDKFAARRPIIISNASATAAVPGPKLEIALSGLCTICGGFIRTWPRLPVRHSNRRPASTATVLMRLASICLSRVSRSQGRR
jgi:hypothetical protein